MLRGPHRRANLAIRHRLTIVHARCGQQSKEKAITLILYFYTFAHNLQ